MKERVEVVRTQHIVGHDTIVEQTGEVSIEEWKEFGRILKGAERYVQWYLGYWWNYGHKKWSRDAEAFIEELGYKRQTLQHYGSVYRLVKPCMRMQDLSFNHHQLVAPLETPKQREYLQKAKEGKWSVSKLREEIKADQPKPELPEGIFDVIYADPPWEYDNSGLAGAAEKHYSVLSTNQICELNVTEKFAKENAVLFLWVTNPFLEDGLKVLTAWGFKYKTNICWLKEGRATYGKLGFYVYGKHELLLIATRGSTLPDGEIPESVISARKSKHSHKPDEFYDLIEKMYIREKYLELFARRKYNNKWEAWGDEI